MGRGARLVSVGAIIGAIAIIAACSSFDDAPTTATSDDAATPTSDAGDRTDDAGSDGGDGGDAGPQPFCKGKTSKLCDDFEDGILLQQPWYPELDLTGTPTPTIGITNGPGNRFLRVDAPMASGQVTAFVHHDLVAVSKSEITFALTLQVTGFVPTDYLEIASLYDPSGGRGAGISIENGALKVYVSSLTAKAIASDAKTRRRIVVTVRSDRVIASDETGQLGEIVTDAGTGVTNGLRFAVGLAYATKSAGGVIEIDDVVLDY